MNPLVANDASPLALPETEQQTPANRLEADSGFGVRQPLWRNVGIVVGEAERPTTWAEARRLAGMDWDPQEEPCFRRRITIKDGEPVETYTQVETFKYIVRPDTDAILSQANTTYRIISNADMGLVMDALLGPENLRFETAGVLHGGRKVWALLEYGDPIELDGDPSPNRRYLGILNSHDGSSALRAINTIVRVSCWNTWKAAELDASHNGACYTFHHSAGWRARLDRVAEDARTALTHAAGQTDAYVRMAQDLLNKPVTPRQEERFSEEFFGATKQDWRLKPRALENVNARRDALLNLIRTSPTCAPIRPSAYRLLQGAGEYLDHDRATRSGGTRGAETRFDRSVLSVYELKRRAHGLALKAANGTL